MSISNDDKQHLLDRDLTAGHLIQDGWCHVFCVCVKEMTVEVCERAVCEVWGAVCVCVCCCWVKCSIVRSLPSCLHVTMGTGGSRVGYSITRCEQVAFRSSLQSGKRLSLHRSSLHRLLFWLLLRRLSSALFCVLSGSLIWRTVHFVFSQNEELRANEWNSWNVRQIHSSGIQIWLLTQCVCECVS